MAIKINPTLKKFYLFLEKHNALMAWENNIVNKHHLVNRAEFLKYINMNPRRFIIAAFQWSKTPEGSTYWQDLHRQWCDEAGV